MAPPLRHGPGQTRGLSGDAQRVLPPGGGQSFYTPFLQKHTTTGDLVEEPLRLWDGPGPKPADRCVGLRPHLTDDGPGGPAFTDVLVVVSAADWQRAHPDGGDAWARSARWMLQERTHAWQLVNGSTPPARPVDFLVVADGSDALGGASLGLRPGQWVTGLLPNLHLGARVDAAPAYAVLSYVPGADGWTRAAVLYGDQPLLTLGNHWLDTARLAPFPCAAFYRLSRTESGELVHRLHPRVAAQYRIEPRNNREQQPVIAIVSAGGAPLAYLAVTAPRPANRGQRPPLRSPEARQTAPPPSSPAKEPRRDPPDTLVPAVEAGQLVEPTALEIRVLTLREEGALLQRVHFGQVMEGYDVEVAADGAVASQLDRPVARVQVRGDRLTLQALAFGATLDDRALDAGDAVPLRGSHTLRLPDGGLEIRDLRGVSAPDWPYLAELRRTGETLYARFGERVTVGRSRRCRVQLPDNPWNGNIVWKGGRGGGDPIRSRFGPLPRKGVYVDAIMVASEHAEIDLTGEPLLRGRARGCATYVRRGDRILTLEPRRRRPDGAEAPQLALQSGDEILVGNCTLAVSLPRDAGRDTDPDPPRPPTSGRPAEAGLLRATDLAAAVSLGAPPPRPDPAGEESTDPDPPGPAPDAVRTVSEANVSIELSRPARLVLRGWRVPPGGRRRVGNHGGADLVLPELRQTGDPAPLAEDLLEVHHHADGVGLRTLAGAGVRVEVARPGQPGVATLRIARGADPEDPDLALRVHLEEHPEGALFLRIEPRDRLAAGILTLGLPRETPRHCTLGKTGVKACYRQGAVEVLWGDQLRVLGHGEPVILDDAVYDVEIMPV